MKATYLAVAAIAFAAAACPADAQTANRDVRCLLLSNLFSKAAPDARGKESAAQTRLFYLGRVSAKFSPTQLQTAMTTEAKTIDPNGAGPEMNKCVASVQASAAAAEAVGAKAQAGIGAKPSPR